MIMRTRLAIVAILLLCIPVSSPAVKVISNPDVVVGQISLSKLRAIFSMRTTAWSNGRPIRVFVLGDKDPLHSEFTKKILEIFPHQLRRAWNRQIFSGTGQAPTRVGSKAEMRARIAATPGAIGYLSEDQIDEHVKTIHIKK